MDQLVDIIYAKLSLKNALALANSCCTEVLKSCQGFGAKHITYIYIHYTTMSVDYIKAQLNNFKLETIASKKEVDQFCHESPYLRTKREVQEELARAEKYRAGILKTLSTFGTARLASNYIVDCPLFLNREYPFS